MRRIVLRAGLLGLIALPLNGCAILNFFVGEPTAEGMVVTVTTPDTELPRGHAVVCHKKNFSRISNSPSDFDISVHVTELDGDNCGYVAFQCGNGPEGPPQRVCIGGAPVNTGCRPAGGAPVKMKVETTFRR